MMNLCQCLQNNVVNSKLTCLIYSSLEALLNINVIATLEDVCCPLHKSSTTTRKFVCVGRFGSVVQSECFAFEQNSVVVNQHRAVNEFERSLAVILEIADCVEGGGGGFPPGVPQRPPPQSAP